MGCNIVITRKGDAFEYFGDDAYYCEPESPDSIFQAVDQAAKNPVRPTLAAKVLNEFTWEIAAKKTQNAYFEVLNSSVLHS
jgi:glycosyltransferase involved in cell wall biosynthesis